MKRALLLILASIWLGATAAQAKDELNIFGRPEKFEPGKQTCYAIWFEGGKWHLRTSSGRRDHPFSGVISIRGGRVTEARAIGTERSGAHKDRWVLTAERHKIVFDFKTDAEGEDGIDFEVDATAETVHWDLEIGGDRGLAHDKERVLVGRRSEHPSEMPFDTKARPRLSQLDKVEPERRKVSETLPIYGRPETFDPGKMSCYAIWFDEGKWHLRSSAGRREHEFRGSIWVHGGKVTELAGVGTERSGAHKDRWVLHPDKHRIYFDFKTDEGGEDGIDFDTDERAEAITWDIEISGERGTGHDKERVLVGRKGNHPDEMPFTTKARPTPERAAEPHFFGRPETFEPGKMSGYAIWYDDGKWHLRTSAGRREHEFKGTITIHGGKVTELKAVGLEGGGEHADRFGRTRDHRKIVFDFKTDGGGEDGIDFDTDADASAITWDLEISGDRGTGHDKERILIGKKGEHPAEMPFETKARPRFERGR